MTMLPEATRDRLWLARSEALDKSEENSGALRSPDFYLGYYAGIRDTTNAVIYDSDSWVE